MTEDVKVPEGMTLTEMAETMARITYEITEQFTEAARNANKMYDTFGDMMRQAPFGVVLGVYLGDHKMVELVLGKSKQCTAALMDISSQIRHVEEGDGDGSE